MSTPPPQPPPPKPDRQPSPGRRTGRKPEFMLHPSITRESPMGCETDRSSGGKHQGQEGPRHEQALLGRLATASHPDVYRVRPAATANTE